MTDHPADTLRHPSASLGACLHRNTGESNRGAGSAECRNVEAIARESSQSPIFVEMSRPAYLVHDSS